jgi:hypothetical protein
MVEPSQYPAADGRRTTMTRSARSPAPVVGAAVYTADGTKLGTVKEIAHSSFKVDARLQPDYWLASAGVVWATGDRVQLSFDSERLGDAMVCGPGYTDLNA